MRVQRRIKGEVGKLYRLAPVSEEVLYVQEVVTLQKKIYMHHKMRFTPLFINYYDTLGLQSKIILGHMNSIG